MKQTTHSALEPLARAALAVAAFALVVMAQFKAWQVFARYVLNDSPSWTEPFALLCMNTTMMFGAAAGVHASRHFGFFVLVENAKPAFRRILLVIAQSIAAAIGVMLACWGGEMVIDAWDYPIAGRAVAAGCSVPADVPGRRAHRLVRDRAHRSPPSCNAFRRVSAWPSQFCLACSS